jgi:type IV pilus assembly protein PilM
MSDIVGIDVGSYAIKMAMVKPSSNGGEILRLAEAYNPVGQFLPADASQFQKLAETIKTLASEQKIKGKTITVGLPESLAYTSVISMPFLSEAELASSIHWEAEQHIPVPIDEINLEYEVLYKPPKDAVGEKMRVLLVGARKDLVERLVNLFQTAGLEVVGLETVILGSHRALYRTLANQEAVITCHIGALTTDVLITNKAEMEFTYSVQTGGLAFTRAVEKGLELPPAQAEEYKRAYGLDPAQLEGKVRQVLMPVVNLLTSEIRKAMQFYQTSHMANPVRAMLLSGGSAYLPGLPMYLAEHFGFEVVLANPLETMTISRGAQQPETLASYIPAIGLAAREP